MLGELLRQPSPEHAAPAGKECTGGGASPAAEPMSERPSQCHRETCIAPRARPRPRTLTIRTPACAGSWRWGIACPRAEFQLEYAAATVLVRLLPAVAPPPVAPRGARRPAPAFGAMPQRLRPLLSLRAELKGHCALVALPGHAQAVAAAPELQHPPAAPSAVATQWTRLNAGPERAGHGEARAQHRPHQSAELRRHRAN